LAVVKSVTRQIYSKLRGLGDQVYQSDPKVARAIRSEIERQRSGAELIPSENYVSRAVLEALGSVFTNKYSEGYPGKRYYGGNEYVDFIEDLAIERAKKLFGAEHVNVQPYSGSPANMAVYHALLNPGDILMGLKLDHGGHLTHGHKVSFSGKNYLAVQYELDPDTEQLNYDLIEDLAKKERPHMILAGYTAYPREINFKRFSEIAKDVGAYFVADISHIAGLVAGGVHQNPVPYADAVMTTTHKTLRGPRGAMILCRQEHAKKIDRAVFPGLQGGPHNHVNAAKAVAFREALRPDFKDYAEQMVKNARALGKVLISHDLRLVSGGTDTHLLLVDLTNKGITGQEASNALEIADIYVNKNTIPFDPRPPAVTSGIRLGTPVMTTRGLKEAHISLLGELICRALDNHNNSTELLKVKKEVQALMGKFPVYRGL